MRLVVLEGTGKTKVGYMLRKTGTAEKLLAVNIIKIKGCLHFWNYAVTNPKYIIYITFDLSQGIKYPYGRGDGQLLQQLGNFERMLSYTESNA